MLSGFILIPLVGTVLILLVPRSKDLLIRSIAIGVVSLTLALAVFFFLSYDRAMAGYQFRTYIEWLPALGLTYHTALDGIGVVMVFLHAVLSFCAVLVSKSIKKDVKTFYALFLVLIASIFGVFISLNLFFLYLFYEMSVIPMYPLIAGWGSKNREYGAMKLTLYISLGAVVALFGLIALYLKSGLQTFDLIALNEHLLQTPLPAVFQKWCAPLLIFGFGVIASIWPLHSWSPIGYAVAPTPVSMLHAGVLKKLGIFFMIRVVLTLLPEGAKMWLPLVAVLCVINVLYGAWAATVQKDMKYTIGFASVSHMGYAFLGLSCLNEIGLAGTVFFLFAHGIMAALCFALIGYIYDQTHTRMIPDLGGLAKQLPFVSVCFVIAAFASSGLPGLANFVSEVMIFFGAWTVYPVPTILAVSGIIFTAVYMLRMVRAVFFGPPQSEWARLEDPSSWKQRLPYALLVFILLVFGFWPAFLIQIVKPSTDQIIVQNHAIFTTEGKAAFNRQG